MFDLAPVFHVPTIIFATVTTLVLVNTPRAMTWVRKQLGWFGKNTGR